MNLNEFFRSPPLLWCQSARYSVRRRVLEASQIPSKARNLVERARYGYGHRDLWSFDMYVAGVISRATKDLADTTHGYPETEGFPTYESWIEYLREISRDLESYSKFFDELEEENYNRGVAAMQRFAKNLGSMWY